VSGCARPWHDASMTDGPLLVFGPLSLGYDLGPGHPLTPRRFGPGLDLLRSIGARPGLAPEPATDTELLRLHDPRYVAAVRGFSADPDREPGWGIGPGDTPVFAGMHDAAAAVAGGSLRAMDALLRGDVDHAFHPGGGLHHAMRDRASGFCIYDDPALAVARARDAGLRVLYVDLDVHHGDGVEAMHADDPGVLTISIHESGRTLFPGTGFLRDIGRGAAAGTCVNVPLDAGTSAEAWLGAIAAIVPMAAAAFGPDVVVSQHAADSHAWDPLAHLRVTVDAMGAAARMVDVVAHRHAGGRWLATGGGGYDVYRVVPRAWALVWLAGAHRDVPDGTPTAWRRRWADEAVRYDQAPIPTTFADDLGESGAREAASAAAAHRTALRARTAVVPALLTEAVDRGWWSPGGVGPGGSSAAGRGPVDGASASPGASAPTGGGPAPAERTAVEILDPLDRAMLDRLRLDPRVIPRSTRPTGRRSSRLRSMRRLWRSPPSRETGSWGWRCQCPVARPSRRFSRASTASSSAPWAARTGSSRSASPPRSVGPASLAASSRASWTRRTLGASPCGPRSGRASVTRSSRSRSTSADPRRSRCSRVPASGWSRSPTRLTRAPSSA